MKRLLTRPEFLAGVIFTAFGAAFFAASAQFKIGSARQMGPGYFPLVLSAALVVLGAMQIVQSALRHTRTEGRGPEERGPDNDRPAVHIRPAVFVLGGLAAFASTMQPLGLIVASVLLVVIAAVVAQGRRWAEVAATAAVLALFSALVFVKLLGVPMPLWPESW